MADLSKDEIYCLYSLVMRWENLMKLRPIPIFTFDSEEIKVFIQEKNLYIEEGVISKTRKKIKDKERYIIFSVNRKNRKHTAFEILKHIRNAFAHGNIRKENNSVFLIDKVKGGAYTTMCLRMEFTVLTDFMKLLLKQMHLDFTFIRKYNAYFISQREFIFGDVLTPHRRKLLEDKDNYLRAIERERTANNAAYKDFPHINKCTFVCPTLGNAIYWCKHILRQSNNKYPIRFYIYKVTFDVEPIWFTYPMENVLSGSDPDEVAKKYWNSGTKEIPCEAEIYVEAPISKNITIIGKTQYELSSENEISEKKKFYFDDYFDNPESCNN